MISETVIQIISDLNPAISGVVVAALATIIIPRYLREPGTGQYSGFNNIVLLYIYLSYALFNAIVIVPRFGYSLESLVRILFTASIPFAAAVFFVWLTDVMGWDKSGQVRK